MFLNFVEPQKPIVNF
jgi:hypothetical protein